jgi:hypothetical protein
VRVQARGAKQVQERLDLIDGLQEQRQMRAREGGQQGEAGLLDVACGDQVNDSE